MFSKKQEFPLASKNEMQKVKKKKNKNINKKLPYSMHFANIIYHPYYHIHILNPKTNLSNI